MPYRGLLSDCGTQVQYNPVYHTKQNTYILRAPDKDPFLKSIMPSSSLNPMFNHLLESSHRDDSNKWSNIGSGEEITQVE